MTVQAWTFVMVGLSFAIYIGVAVRSRASSTDEFYVAAARVPPAQCMIATQRKATPIVNSAISPE